MKLVLKTIICLVLFCPLLVQAQHPAQLTELTREQVSEIKIIGSDVDRIHMFLKDQEKRVYRISAVSEKEARSILTKLSEESLLVETRSVKNRNYLDVLTWE